MMYGPEGNYGMYGGMGWSYLIPIVLLLIIVIVVVLFVTNNQPKQHPHYNSALDELNKKFVNGEISEEEYLRKKDLIKK